MATIAVLIVAVLGGAAYYFLAYDEVTAARKAFTGSGEVSCTFVDPNTDEEVELYVSDGDIRMNMQGQPVNLDASQSNDELVLNHILFMNDTAYIWTEGENQGYQYPMELEGDIGPLGNLDDEEEFKNEYEEYNYSCGRGADDGLFEKPDDVEFTDFGSTLDDA